ATAFWAYAPAALTPPPWRPLAYAAATLFGLIASALRMAFGGHFFTDVTTAGLVTFLVIWLAYGMIYRWQRTRLSDEAIAAALTRFAWPAFRAMRRWRGRDAGPRPATSSACARVGATYRTAANYRFLKSSSIFMRQYLRKVVIGLPR